MSSALTKIILPVTSILFSSSLLAFSSSPVYVADIKLGFQNKSTCQLSEFKSGKTYTKGRVNISHNENDISWTSMCHIKLPSTVHYCLISSQTIDSLDVFLSYSSVFKEKIIRVKIISESDINPSFGSFSVTYHCFE